MRVLTLDGGRLDWSPDGSQLAFDRFGPDRLADVWIADRDGTNERCLTCDSERLGLPPGNKGNPEWHPGGEWIVIQAEMANHPGPQGSPFTHPGSGQYNDLWIVRADGTQAFPLRELDPTTPNRGTLHPHFDDIGRRLVWSEYIRGAVTYPDVVQDPSTSVNDELVNRQYGDWEVAVAEFAVGADGIPVLGSPTFFRPGSRGFYETHAFTPDGNGVLLSGNPDKGQPVTGIDIAVLDLRTGTLTRRVTDTPDEWDEHAKFLPATRRGEPTRMIFASSRGTAPDTSYPYPQNPTPAGAATPPRLELWVDVEGGAQSQLTFFNDPSWSYRPPGVDGVLSTTDNAVSPDGRDIAVLLARRQPLMPAAPIYGNPIVIIRLADSSSLRGPRR